MGRDKFAALLIKYQEGKCTQQEKELVEYWFALTGTEPTPDITNAELDGMHERIWAGMQDKVDAEAFETTRVVPLRRLILRWSSIAAALVLLTWFGFGDRLKNIFNDGNNVAGSSWVEKRNNGSMPLAITLEDSSTVELSPNSVLSFPEHFESGRRVVVLKGKGFFKIRKNPNKPFYVHSGQTITRVLGTSFYVDSKTPKTKVEVVTGLVSVVAATQKNAKPAEPVMLTPNHQATFDPASGTFASGLVDSPRLLDETISFQFRNEPLSTVAAHITSAWGIEVRAKNRQILYCPLTADLSGQPLFIQLDIICAALNARYRIENGVIVISGEGCQAMQAKSVNHKSSPMKT
ncbi:FecR family protein [Dyadobacter sp. MSC1_007]|jgi:transmembrane sensor|uniref:FecR family protein n=1 Tax=Dyadobacter sp. MSC1_007 TaxID=2909264 RepID=UPI00202EB81E|nr:FecR domain-containing protein [Dyadobacter sp. MSC1_007]